MGETAPTGDGRTLAIIGAGGHASSVAEVAWSCGYSVIAFVDHALAGRVKFDVPVVADLPHLGEFRSHAFAIAIGENALRERVLEKTVAAHGDLRFPALIHASAIVARHCSVGRGTVAMPGAIVGAGSVVGEFCIVNTNASLDHDSVMKDFSSIAPGSTTGGGVIVGRRSAVSIGSVVKQGVTIGDDSVLGANSFLNKNLADNLVAYGNPAVSKRTRDKDDRYLR